MVKIATGATGQADFVSESCLASPVPGGDTNGAFLDGYGIKPHAGGFFVLLWTEDMGMGGTPEPMDWNVSSSGTVKVPLTLSPGQYIAVHETYGGCTPDGETAGSGYQQKQYEFEVVCMTVEISAEETYRDATKYRLSCTATPQGGTAPYEYEWSSSINGSSVISGQTSQTLVVEIPVGEPGTISVFVTDDSQPVSCTATASFEVCGMTCDFTAALLEVRTDGTYIYECKAYVGGTGNFPPYTYEWSPTPVETFEEGRVARFSFPDDEEYSIHLSVENFQSCKAFKTRKVGGYEFVVSTTPGGTGAGTPDGARDSMKFVVEVEATATARLPLPPPATVTLEFRRPKTNEATTAIATLVSASNPPKYVLSPGWDVTQFLGKWHIQVQGHPSSTAQFKIDKRQQIVQVANSWSNATQSELTAAGATVCNQLTAKIYNHVGLPLSGTITPQYDSATVSCSGDGCLLFYAESFKEDWDPAHVAVKADGQRVNVNSATKPFPANGASKEAEDAGVTDEYKAEIRIGSTVDLDED